MHGKGKLKTALGVYTGDFVEGRMHSSNGRMEYADGAVYEGEFVHGERHGEGKLTLPDKSIYVGHFEVRIRTDAMFPFRFHSIPTPTQPNPPHQANQMHGQGKLTSTDGVYEGSFRSGVKHGVCVGGGEGG